MASFGVSRHWRFTVILSLLFLLILPQPSPVNAASCNTPLYGYGGGRASAPGFGGRANIENTTNRFACYPDGSKAFVRIYDDVSGNGVMAGYSKYDFNSGTGETKAFMIWEESNGSSWEHYRDIAQDGKYRLFQVIRDRTYDPQVVWDGEFYSPEGIKYTIFTAKDNMSYPKNHMTVYNDATDADDRFFGSSGDPANYSGFAYRDDNKEWHLTQLQCVKHLYVIYRHLSCTDGDFVGSFTTWDDRN